VSTFGVRRCFVTCLRFIFQISEVSSEISHCFTGYGEVRGARCEECIVRGSVRGIRARIGVISEAVCEAAVRYWGGSVSSSRRQGTDQAPLLAMGNKRMYGCGSR